MTLCAAASVNVRATVLALERCLDQANFGECLFFTDSDLCWADARIKRVPIGRLSSAAEYSKFVLTRLVEFIRTPHCLIAQWDGFVIDGTRWDPLFLSYDYIGAPWPQFEDGHDVGNGGFSLRSRKLLEACRDQHFEVSHPEDLAICRLNRALLEREHGIRFPDRTVAARFSFERTEPAETFGFHGVFNIIPVLGEDQFWALYEILDSKSTAFVDYRQLMRQLSRSPASIRRRARLTLDRIFAALGRRRRS